MVGNLFIEDIENQSETNTQNEAHVHTFQSFWLNYYYLKRFEFLSIYNTCLFQGNWFFF